MPTYKCTNGYLHTLSNQRVQVQAVTQKQWRLEKLPVAFALRPPSKRSAKHDKLAMRALRQDKVKPTGHLTYALNNAGVRSPL